MALWDLFKRKKEPDRGAGVEELARRLGMSSEELRAIKPEYKEFSIPKRSGGRRVIHAPTPELKALQRRIARRLLARLKANPAACGFERRQSIVTHAMRHAGKAVVVRMDIQDFFPATSAGRVESWFFGIGWNRETSGLLASLCCHAGGLPQGAPTSPRLSNLVNARLDSRLMAFATRAGAVYSRYADDLTCSFSEGNHSSVSNIIRFAKKVFDEAGYTLHSKKKLSIRRRHQRQIVTGLVVNNARPVLPRETRRWLRAVAHRVAAGREPTLNPQQIAGWYALQWMIARQSGESTR